MKTTIFLFHPDLATSQANAALVYNANVEVRDLYHRYPDGQIDVPAEQAALTATDRVVLQFPMYWYSSPALLKKWEDLVLEHGWAYGSQGHALEGKEVLLAVTLGVSETEYQPHGKQGHTVTDFLLPLLTTVGYTGMHVLPPFIVGNAFYLSAPELTTQTHRYHQILTDPTYGQQD